MRLKTWLRGGCALVPMVLAAVLIPQPVRTQPAPPPVAPPGLEKIQQFVFIMQENRSFDHYFGTYPGAEGMPPGVCLPNGAGPCVALYHNTAAVNQGGADAQAFRDLQAENQQLKEAIELAWDEGGLPTFLRYLRDYIESRKVGPPVAGTNPGTEAGKTTPPP